ncbi:GT2 family glycosyltransferase [Thermosporothrix hazakensis]|jgi:glycosyltransferase involved in cell wall biosynthesis|uniref:GT2 family glycosyltransferase n=1 Tax=Thermosporothrix hazakensis TaxID=644383 RepID=A0A326TWU9_THEHA|nr:glycosyltransferase family 2 protein [Thermosporothrix hazakensis]PZW20813.1 GT2 family glycosyltransferase [Thermosporothrix hazakensis]GCE47532.1 hypothetical protein KTH_24010 [Thermosporothrix hazakensis]
MTLQHPKRQEQQASVFPRISVILCTYNRQSLLLSVLRNLYQQTLPFSYFEVLIVDNSSTDMTAKEVQRLVHELQRKDAEARTSWRVFYLSEPRNGLAHARNLAITKASGEILVFLDDDVIVNNGFLKALLHTYDTTTAAAVSGRVELHWEGRRPYWVHDRILPDLGYFAPTEKRTRLTEETVPSNCCFSIRASVLHALDLYFMPCLNKRNRFPINLDIERICISLQQAGYEHWYEPEAIVYHRVPAERIQPSFFIGRAYWRGCAEILEEYVIPAYLQGRLLSFQLLLWEGLLSFLNWLLYAIFLHPLQTLSQPSTGERLHHAMTQAYLSGRYRQVFSLLWQPAALLESPSALFVQSSLEEGPPPELWETFSPRPIIHCGHRIPLWWLWHNRAPQKGEASRALLHIYRPGAFQLTYRQRLALRLRLHLALRFGIRLLTTDGGGWWQSASHRTAMPRKALEGFTLRHSHQIITFAGDAARLYQDPTLGQRTLCCPYPGTTGPQLLPSRALAHAELGLPEHSGFVYLCFAHYHTELELLYLLTAFIAARNSASTPLELLRPQVIIAGLPTDTNQPRQLLQLAANASDVHLFFDEKPLTNAQLGQYLSAADALVQPHQPIAAAGELALTWLALLHRRQVIVPALPRFQGTLPPQHCIFYLPESRASLIEALLSAARNAAQERVGICDETYSWQTYSALIQQLYQRYLFPAQ